MTSVEDIPLIYIRTIIKKLNPGIKENGLLVVSLMYCTFCRLGGLTQIFYTKNLLYYKNQTPLHLLNLINNCFQYNYILTQKIP